MTGKLLYHIANLLWILGASSIVVLILSRYLVIELKPAWKILFYSFIVVGAILRYLAKRNFPDEKDPIIENRLAKVLYYSGHGIFMLMVASIVIFHYGIPLLAMAVPLVILMVSWVVSLMPYGEEVINDDLLDDNFS